ncbi:PC-Esterase [Corchorus olitorius]|uniref:PC-Esterase n=1 Tax=Corchorus olitorius TaxID=93759 RepID=A0A1R3J370_9ROSI|nr:PC-Esterase [Corchorus olitorius]
MADHAKPDREYEKYRWQPDGCNLPRLNGKHMLELLRGKRVVFVGDSLGRNMWESLNYNCSIEYLKSHFLVQEWQMHDTKKETLRLDMIDRLSDEYKNADVLIFNTGHWWTHDKTPKGKGYYQEGSTIYDELNVDKAYRKALTTWATWIDSNIDPMRTLVFFRGFSATHFWGGRWDLGGKCHGETQPITNDKFLKKYPLKMQIFESVLNGMTTPILYLNVSRMTGFRKDGHPSIYRRRNLTVEERIPPTKIQDCSHWCLPGVPDAWNELLYAQLLVKHYEKQQQLLHHEEQQRRS